MENLSTCTIEEFMKAVTKIRPLFTEWVKKTEARDPRESVTEDMTRAERLQAIEAALGRIMVSAFEKAPDLTRELLCLATFTPPDEFNAYTLKEYYDAAIAMYNNDAVRSFFTSFVAQNPATSSKH